MTEYNISEDEIEKYSKVIVEFNRTIEDSPVFIDSLDGQEGEEQFVFSSFKQEREGVYAGFSPAFPDPIAIDFTRGVVFDLDVLDIVYGDIVEIREL